MTLTLIGQCPVSNSSELSSYSTLCSSFKWTEQLFLNGLVTYATSPYIQWKQCISGIVHRKLKFSMYSSLTNIITIFEYCHASVDVSCLEDRNVYRPVLKNKTATCFFSKKPFLVYFVQREV